MTQSFRQIFSLSDFFCSSSCSFPQWHLAVESFFQWPWGHGKEGRYSHSVFQILVIWADKAQPELSEYLEWYSHSTVKPWNPQLNHLSLILLSSCPGPPPLATNACVLTRAHRTPPCPTWALWHQENCLHLSSCLLRPLLHCCSQPSYVMPEKKHATDPLLFHMVWVGFLRFTHMGFLRLTHIFLKLPTSWRL